MWHRRPGFYGFSFGFPPFSMRWWRRFPHREDYLKMLEDYKAELEEELREVEKEIESLKKE